jgi:ribosomal protein L22
MTPSSTEEPEDIEGSVPDPDAPGLESAEVPAVDASARGASEGDPDPSIASAEEDLAQDASDDDLDAPADVVQAPEVAVEDDVDDEDAPAPKKPRRGARGRAGSQPEPPKPEKPAKAARSAAPTPSRRRAQRDPGAPLPVVRAQAKYVRSSARKARVVCDHIRGKSVEEARAILAVTPRAIARDWSKLLESAVANAEHNHELVGEDLVIKAVHADEGPTLKRFRPRARGVASKIRKRTSHLTILLTPKD